MKNISLLLLSFLFISCGGNDYIPEVDVDSGTALTSNVISSRNCSKGSVQIYSDDYGKSLLTGGESVNISGKIFAADSCFQQAVTFSCTGNVAVGINRTFNCNQGKVEASGHSSFGPSPSPFLSLDAILSPLPASLHQTQPNSYGSTGSVYSAPLISGQVNIYNNGTKTSVSITYQNPSTAGFICKHGFVCSESE